MKEGAVYEHGRGCGRDASKYKGPRRWGPSIKKEKQKEKKDREKDEYWTFLHVKPAANPRRRDNDTARLGAVSGVLQAASASFMSCVFIYSST